MARSCWRWRRYSGYRRGVVQSRCQAGFARNRDRAAGNRWCRRLQEGRVALHRQFSPAGAALGAGAGRGLSQRHSRLCRPVALSRTGGGQGQADRDACGADEGIATRADVPPAEIFDRVRWLLRTAAGGARPRPASRRERLILDPGMGFFLGSDPETSLTVLRRLAGPQSPASACRCWSRSRENPSCENSAERPAGAGGPGGSAGRRAVCRRQGADYIRTHAPGASARTALKVSSPP